MKRPTTLHQGRKGRIQMRKGVRRLLVVLAVLLVFFAGAFAAGRYVIEKAESGLEALSAAEIPEPDLLLVKDGVWRGSWSAFPVKVVVDVTVSGNRIVSIELIEHRNGQGEGAELIPSRVVEAQSLQVHSVSGATYSSKVMLLAIGDALSSGASR
jgi:uncharacterized protein with FMN-binding domain